MHESGFAVDFSKTEPQQAYLNGGFVAPQSAVMRRILNPATTELLALAAECDTRDVDLAVRAAQRAWWRVPGVEKAGLLRRVGARIRAQERQLAALMTLETGKPFIEAKDCSEWVAACFKYYGEIARRSFGNSIPPVAPYQVNFTIKEPFGDVAARGVAWAWLLNASQVCTSSKRSMWRRRSRKPLMRNMLAHVRTLRLGDPRDPATDIGPLIEEAALERVAAQVEHAIAEGAELRLGGRRAHPGGLAGYFFESTVLTGVRHGSLPTTEEIFGPIPAITVARDAAQAIAMANDSKYGLGACIYINNLETAMTAMHELKAGMFWINDPLTDNEAGPFGGMRHSGIGRELGEEGLDAFREPKHVHLDYRIEAKDYWYPYAKRS